MNQESGWPTTETCSTLPKYTKVHLEKTYQDMQPGRGMPTTRYFYSNPAAPRQHSLNETLHRTKNKVSKPKLTRIVRARPTAKTPNPSENKQTGNAGLMKSWLQTAAAKHGTGVRTEHQEIKQIHHSDLKIPTGRTPQAHRKARSWHTFPAS